MKSAYYIFSINIVITINNIAIKDIMAMSDITVNIITVNYIFTLNDMIAVNNNNNEQLNVDLILNNGKLERKQNVARDIFFFRESPLPFTNVYIAILSVRIFKVYSLTLYH